MWIEQYKYRIVKQKKDKERRLTNEFTAMDIEIRFRISCNRFSNWSRGNLEVPYMAGIGGGGAFFLIFIGFTLLIGLPLLLAEFVIGRSTQKRPLMRIEKSHQKHYGHG